ncbi:MAG: NAD(P)/FAD-dependent oxidoreductase, partial [Alphaproteobacteria bacterium]
GGQCSALYPEKPIYDIPAHPKILASELIELLEAQANPFHPVYHLNQQVVKISENADKTFLVETSKDTKILCKAIIIAAGCGAFGPNRPPLENIENYEGKSIFYSVRSKKEFTDKNVVIAGGGDSAVDWAISLSEIAKKIYLVHRRDKFRCAPDSSQKLKELANAGKVELVVPYQLEGLTGDKNILQKVIVKDFDNNIKELEADYLLPFFGLAMELGPILDWGLNLHKNHIEVNQANMRTNVTGIYAVGDIATYPNKLKLILTGFAECASACHDIFKLIFPDQVYHFEYSTSKGVS